MTTPEESDQIDEDRANQWYAFVKELLLYGATHLSQNQTDITKAEAARPGFVKSFKEVAGQWYVILTLDEDTTLLEKAKKKAAKLNPLRQKARFGGPVFN